MKHTAIAFLVAAAGVAASGCTNLLEDSVLTVVPHESTPYVRPPVELVTISDTDGFRRLLLELIMAHEEAITIQYQGADNEAIQADTLRISQEIVQADPIGAYAVTDIAVTARKIVAYSEIDIEISYKKTAEQIASIIEAPTPRYMLTQLFEILGGYKEEAVFLTNMQLEKEEIVSQVVELYYQNPSRVAMLPFVTVEIYPEEPFGQEEPSQPERRDPTEGAHGDRPKIYEVKFGYLETAEMLREIGDNLILSVRQNAARAEGDISGERLLSLAGNLIASTEYDEGTAGTIAMHGPQNIAATAFGALVRGSAVGEGFAMAFKALCDELRLDCRVVLGFYNDMYHAWNIVFLSGNYYHIDVAMCASNGLEAGFLKTDEDFAGLYKWDLKNTPHCDGSLTLGDFLPPEEPGETGDSSGTGTGAPVNQEGPEEQPQEQPES